MAIDELAPGSSHERQARAAAWAGGAGSGGRGGARPQGERMTILGIDPGKSGAVAVLDEGDATQLGGMENAPKALARIILAEQAREALGHNEAGD